VNGAVKISPTDFLATCTTGYRFTFNGQEKTDEISGAGNHNTALYWEYDTRLGRRWNVDPETKFNESSYLTFSGNPIFFIDPIGNSATKYQDENGILIRETKDGNNEKVVTVLDEQMANFKVWEKIGDEKGVMDNAFYNKSLTNTLEKGQNIWKRFTTSKIEFTAGAQGQFEFTIGNVVYDFTVNAGSAGVVSSESNYIDGIQVGKGFNYYGKGNETQIKREISVKAGGGFSLERTRTGYTTAGMKDDAANSYSAQVSAGEYKVIHKNNVVIQILIAKQSVGVAGGVGLNYKVGTGIIKKTVIK